MLKTVHDVMHDPCLGGVQPFFEKASDCFMEFSEGCSTAVRFKLIAKYLSRKGSLIDSFDCSSERQMLASWVSNRSIPFLSFSTNVWLFGHIALHHKRKNSETQSQMITEYKQYTMQATFFSDIVVFFGNGKLNYVYSVLLFQRTTMKPKTT